MVWRSWRIGLALMLAVTTASALAEDDAVGGVPIGQVIDDVVSIADPSQSYALYLPSAYSVDRRWPVLLVLDARGRGALGAELFAPGAEAHGYVVLSSNISRSDEESAPNLRAVAAMLQDARNHLAVDPRRVYVAGLSGTARFAWALGVRGDEALPGSGGIAGVISASGGLPDAQRLWRKIGVPVYGTAGEWDFNLTEMRDQDEVAATAGVPHRLETFDGGHRWPPQDLAAEALEWLKLQAMRSGLAERDEAWIDALWRRRLARARTLDEIGDRVRAIDLYRALRDDFPERAGEAAIEARLRALETEPAVERRLETEARWKQREAEYRGRVATATRSLRDGRFPPVDRMLRELDVAELQETAASATEPEERAGARRLLEILATQVAFYLPRELFASDRPRSAAAALEIALAIRPESPELWYNLACAHARLDHPDEALAALRRAYDTGFRDLDHIAADPDLDSLADNPDFTRLLTTLSTRQPHPGTSLAPL